MFSDVTLPNRGTIVHYSVCHLLHFVVLSIHVSHLLKTLEPVWAQWELLGQALHIPQAKLDNIKSNHQLPIPSCQNNLSSVIKVFGAITPFKEHTWRKIYEAVKVLDKMDIAEAIEKEHKDLNDSCKVLWLKIIILFICYSAT